jgi:hypothetical protein
VRGGSIERVRPAGQRDARARGEQGGGGGPGGETDHRVGGSGFMTVVGIPLDRGDRGGSNDTKNMCGVAVLSEWQTRENR